MANRGEQSSTGGALVPSNLEEVGKLARALSSSKLLPEHVRSTADLAVTILQGIELGLKPLQAIRSIHVVDGKPILSADLIAALVMRSGDCEYLTLVESTDQVATYETKRRGSPKPVRLSWTIADAKRAGLTNKSNWQRHPAAMLRARAKAALAREVYPDSALGLYEHDEGEEMAAPARPVPSEQPAELDEPPERKTTERFIDGRRRTMPTAPLPIAEHDFRSSASDVDDDLPLWAGGDSPNPPLELTAADVERQHDDSNKRNEKARRARDRPRGGRVSGGDESSDHPGDQTKAT